MKEKRYCPECSEEVTSKWGSRFCSSKCGNRHMTKLRMQQKKPCPICSKEFDPAVYKRHVNSCRIQKEKLLLQEQWRQEDGSYKCPFCDKCFKEKGIRAHIWRSHTEEGQNFNARKNYIKGTQIGWNKGKTCEESMGEEKAVVYRQKLSKAMRNNPRVTGKAKTASKERERCEKISKAVKGKTGGHRKGSGRGKKGRYKDYWCDSSWELAFVIYHLEHNLAFSRNWQKFEYSYQGQILRWIPDFKIGYYFIEVKGYKTKQSKAKFDFFTKPLIVLYEEDMQPILDYVAERYGKDFIKLYDEAA